MKTILLLLLFLVSSFHCAMHASTKIPESIHHFDLVTDSGINIYGKSTGTTDLTFHCSVTSSGTISSGGFTSIITLTVYGPCSSQLATMMRKAIADARTAFK